MGMVIIGQAGYCLEQASSTPHLEDNLEKAELELIGWLNGWMNGWSRQGQMDDGTCSASRNGTAALDSQGSWAFVKFKMDANQLQVHTLLNQAVCS